MVHRQTGQLVQEGAIHEGAIQERVLQESVLQASVMQEGAVRILPAGEGAVLVELPDLPSTLALYRTVRSWCSRQDQPWQGVSALVPAARTLLVRFAPWQRSAGHWAQVLLPLALQAVECVEAGLEQGAAAAPTSAPQNTSAARLVHIPVHYDGQDLPTVAQLLGLRVADLIAQHTAQPYEAAFAGFAPGFVYLSGGPQWQVPRRASPRTRVPAGAVALGGAFSAVYPTASPGGWQLIGHTTQPMWDMARPEPATVQPGDRVQFVDAAKACSITCLPAAVKIKPNGLQSHIDTRHDAIEIISTGLQTLVQDEGRMGQAARGISTSGALDLGAMHRANALVGNPRGTPVLEHLLGGLQLRSHGRTTVAVAGAHMPLQLHAADGGHWPVACHQAVALDDGDTLHLGPAAAGVRGYVAVRGGWHIEPVLGSCAYDSLAHIGPAPLHAGQRIAVGQAVPAAQLQPVQLLPEAGAHTALPQAGDTVTLHITLGPRSDWFTPQALELLTQQAWQVSAQSNRVGLRLQGAQGLQRSQTQELPSEGTVPGAIQVPASGQPVLFMADHPLTGGYPVIAVLAPHHMGLAAQLPVGCWLRFAVVPVGSTPFEGQR